MKEYLLFDLDGTLTDPKVGITTCVQYALKSFGIEEPDLDKLEPFIGPPLKDSFMQFYEMNEKDAEAAVEKYRERFKDVGLFENEVYEGIPQMLKTLKNKGMHLAVASSKPTVYVERILEHFEIREYFEAVVGSELDGRRVNKDEVVAEALKQLFGEKEIEYSKVYMIGDRKFDVEGARALGVESIGVSYGYGSLEELKEAGADYMVTSVSELSYVLLREFREVEPRGMRQVVFPFVGSLLLYFLAAAFASNIFFIVASCVLVFPWAAHLTEYAKYDMYIGHVRRQPAVSYLVLLFSGAALLLGTHMLMNLSIEIPFLRGCPFVEEIAEKGILWKQILYIGIFVPFLEELVFRGIVYNVFRFKMNLVLAMSLSALLYALFQIGLEKTPYLIAFGFLLAYAYEYFGTFAVPVLLHIACAVLHVIMERAAVSVSILYNWPLCIVLLLVALVGTTILNKEKKII